MNAMTTKEQIAAEMIGALNEHLSEITDRLDRYKGVMLGTPYVIELGLGFYLVAAENGGYKGDSITGKVVMYSPEKTQEVVEYVREQAPTVWGNARAVHIKDALFNESESVRKTIKHIAELSA